MARNAIYVEVANANGKTLTVYEYDSGQANNRGTLLGTMTLGANGSTTRANFFYDLDVHKRVVVVMDGANIDYADGAMWNGDEPANDSIKQRHLESVGSIVGI